MKTMRGFKWLTGWMFMTASASGKKWHPSTIGTAHQAMLEFVKFRSWIERDKKRMGWVPSPLRLLGPGGIIVAESHTRQRNAPRVVRRPRRQLVTTAQLRSSITAPITGGFTSRTQPSLLTRTSPIYGGGYGFLTMRDPRNPRRI